MINLDKRSKKVLINRIKELENKNIHKTSYIRHLEKRLLKIRNSIDYLLSHPYSCDTGMNGLKHKRDTKVIANGIYGNRSKKETKT